LSRVFRTRSRLQRALPPPPVQPKIEEDPVQLPDLEAMAAEAKREAEALLAKAKEEAESLLQEALARREDVLAEAREAGRDEGYAEGHSKGLSEAEGIIREAEEVLESARGAYKAMLAEVEPKLLALAIEVARRVVNDSFEADSTVVLELIRKGLASVRDEREFQLRVDPSLVALVEGEKEALCQEVGAKSIEVVGDAEVSGGAVVRTPHGFVDVTIESQIRNVAHALAEARKKVIGAETQ
jgi:flagellar assembly protein FliH